MIIRIYGTNYKIDQNLALSVKSTIRQILGNVKTQAELKHFEKYYTAFVVMMYVISSTILKELSRDSIQAIIESNEADRKTKEKAAGSNPPAAMR